MIKHVLSGAMAFALLAGVSYAQDDTSVTRQRTVVTAPYGDRAVSTDTTVRRNDGGDRSAVTHDTVRRTDGDDSSVTSRTTRTTATPYGDTSSTTVQKTTTDR
jgi:hypothetical protein